ncbi:Peptidase family M28 [Nonomuraea maritima]|uniref:Peptidase family M28 n=1 Tax=Nonomuraea maritima TaxID=683260 RepID=A0A1G9E0E7_9ACTN|nr:M28 family peptidase [Nonomuraea maritima]SDK69520.1 Peptidase family M28 [Nonomuraea maritima]
MTEMLFPRRVLAGGVALFTLAVVIALTALTDGAMRPLPASAPAAEFSAERALRHLERFADRPRPIGSPASTRARAYLIGQLRAAGLDVRVQRAVGANSSTGLASFGLTHDIVATKHGTDSSGTVLIAAHYDSAAMGPGAADDGAAVAAVLETVRALGGERLRNDLVFLLTDGEEDGVLGARAFVREHRLGRAGGVLLNWEARGVGGPSLLFESTRGNAGLVETFARAVPEPRGDSMMVELYRMLPNNTDFTPLTEAGFTGMNFAFIEGSSRYHTADDSLAYLDPGSLQHHGANMLALARALGAAELTSLASDDDVTYFRIFGVMVTYPNALVWPLALLGLAAVAGLAAIVRRRRLASVPRILAGVVWGAVPLVLAVVLAQALWEVLVAVRPAYDGMGGLPHRPEAFRAAVAVLAWLAVLGAYLPLRRRIGPAAPAVGGLAWPALLGVVCAQVAPGASFMFTLPALACALGTLVALLLPAGPRVAAVTAGASVAAALLPALAGVAFDGMGLALGGVSALALALFGLTLLPLVELCLWLERPGQVRFARVLRSGRLGLLVAAGLAVALVAGGLAFDRFDASHPGRTHLAYVMDADTRTAAWVSADLDPPAWTRTYVSARDTGHLPPGYARGALWTGPASAIDADGPRVELLSRGDGGYRLRVTPGRGARSVTLRVERPITGATAQVRGTRPVAVEVTGVRANTWPGEVRFRGLPASGAVITLRATGTGPLRVTAISETDGLTSAPGYVPRPPGLVAATREDGDLVAVTRTYRF